ncbi:hypothetical protein PAXRUDRAFT_831809 [Paxillus rubicundulus Ve08.2h10]|uniref:Unplaced genomic scaffold scaffold_714, whole genome shotgun sequence n=1 Tax=Paxillus rubicundulus Ve08.2h10 TaxID=930991 RepID=A0A0D0DEJ4_9AGAM|nr:hypothetical protein PAXRUDRAFT_831809 [Paxillus rubicundulus Ve08.2h10]
MHRHLLDERRVRSFTSISLHASMSERIEQTSIHSSQAEVWYLKEILFGPRDSKRRIKIITQNFNGPCSFIAICNILVLRGNIEILPYDRSTVSYELLSQLVGEYLLLNCPDIDISAALSIMPSTTKGLDLNPQFTGVTSFHPAGDAGELKLFEQAGIKLVHGWLVDPDSPEARMISQIRDYDNAVTLIADADHITKGKLLTNYDAYNDRDAGLSEAGPSQPGPSHPASQPQGGSSSGGGGNKTYYYPEPRSPSNTYSEQDRQKIEYAVTAQQFLDTTKSQLTYHGLFQLASTTKPGSLVALFRNSHLSVLYRSEDDNSALYSLVTDYVFLNEPSVVWERLEDIDGGWSTFVDSDFNRAAPVGGDFAGLTAEGALRAFEVETGQFAPVDPADQALARQLQAEEDQRARQRYLRRQQAVERQRAEEEQRKKKTSNGNKENGKNKKMKEKCIIM